MAAYTTSLAFVGWDARRLPGVIDCSLRTSDLPRERRTHLQRAEMLSHFADVAVDLADTPRKKDALVRRVSALVVASGELGCDAISHLKRWYEDTPSSEWQTALVAALFPLDATRSNPPNDYECWDEFGRALLDSHLGERGMVDEETLRRFPRDMQNIRDWRPIRNTWTWFKDQYPEAPQPESWTDWLRWILPYWSLSEFGHFAQGIGIPATFPAGASKAEGNHSLADRFGHLLVSAREYALVLRSQKPAWIATSSWSGTFRITQRFKEEVLGSEPPLSFGQTFLADCALEVAKDLAGLHLPEDAQTQSELVLQLILKVATILSHQRDAEPNLNDLLSDLKDQSTRSALERALPGPTITLEDFFGGKNIGISVGARRILCSDAAESGANETFWQAMAFHFLDSADSAISAADWPLSQQIDRVAVGLKAEALCRLILGPPTALLRQRASAYWSLLRKKYRERSATLSTAERASTMNALSDLGLFSYAMQAIAEPASQPAAMLFELDELSSQAGERLLGDDLDANSFRRALVNQLTGAQVRALMSLSDEWTQSSVMEAAKQLFAAGLQAAAYAQGSPLVGGFPARNHFCRCIVISVAVNPREPANRSLLTGLASSSLMLSDLDTPANVPNRAKTVLDRSQQLFESLIDEKRAAGIDRKDKVVRLVELLLPAATPPYRLTLRAAQSLSERYEAEPEQLTRRVGTLLLS